MLRAWFDSCRGLGRLPGVQTWTPAPPAPPIVLVGWAQAYVLLGGAAAGRLLP